MAEVLLFNPGNGDRLSRLRFILFKLGIRARIIPREDFGQKLGFLAGLGGYERADTPEEGSFSDEMLMMVGFSGALLDAFLKSLRQERVSIPRKAVITEHNAEWSAIRLHRELSLEMEAMQTIKSRKASQSSVHRERRQPRILFVCLGNICRSPMAEYLFREYARQIGRAEEFIVASRGLVDDEAGEGVYPPAKRLLEAHGISCDRHHSTLIEPADYDRYDLIIGMDKKNLSGLQQVFGGDPAGKIRLLMDYTDKPHDIPDPWFTGEFEAVWDDICAGCGALLKAL